VLSLTEHHAMKAYWGSGGVASRILDLGTDGSEWSASLPGRFTPRERAPGTHWLGDWVGCRAGLQSVVRRKILSLCRDWNPQLSNPLAQRCTTDLSQLRSSIVFQYILCYMKLLPPLPQYVLIAWYLIKHGENFTFTFTWSSSQTSVSFLKSGF
jgi:hypothetical protein